MKTLTRQPVPPLPVSLPPGLTSQAAHAWQTLRRLPAVGVFDPHALSGEIPEAARRWLVHALTPGSPLAAAATLRMQGEIRLGRRWHRFRATQVLAPGHGYVWAAVTGLAGLPIVGFDRYSDGTGEMRWRLGRVLPLVSASGDDVATSAAGRLASELALLPTAYSVATWSSLPSQDRFVGRTVVDGRVDEVQFEVSATGRLRSVHCDRWGSPLGEPYGRYPFGVVLRGDATFHGITVPTQITAGWFIGTDRWGTGEFYRAHLFDLVPTM